ncbi:MAG: glycosyltransferase family 2 protein [Geminicoccaceae bacterium]
MICPQDEQRRDYTPEVSIGLPVYNGERYLEACIRSVLSQSLDDLQFVISDNASTDRTEEICRDLAASDRRIHYIRQAHNRGAAANYNICLDAAKGRYFHWINHDDRLLPDYLRGTRDVLAKHDDVALAFTHTRLIDEDGRPLPYDAAANAFIDRQGLHRRGQSADDIATQADPVARFADVFARMTTVFHIFGLSHTEIWRQTRGHRPVYGADKNLVAEVALYGRFHVVPAVQYEKREHAEQSIAIRSAEGRARWIDPKARKSLFPHLALQKQNLEAIWNAPISFGDRCALSAHVMRNLGVRIMLDPRNWRPQYLDQHTIG